MDRKALRSHLISKRDALSPDQARSFSATINSRLWRLPAFARSKNIACYFAVRGEVDCDPIIAEAWQRGRRVFLPVLADKGLMFARFQAETQLHRNHFGIPEPAYNRRELLRPMELDVVICPLVAFDEQNNRLGMGAGYYDKSFRFLLHGRSWLHPRLIGAAYEFQKIPEIRVHSWDVPMQNVVTEKQVYDSA
jgi:5-formyltetrahydrofolate cyclo-ligase